jgi:hypothetical protein
VAQKRSPGLPKCPKFRGSGNIILHAGAIDVSHVLIKLIPFLYGKAMIAIDAR